MRRLQINTLEKGFQEWDILLLHACFQILVDYWEKDAIPWGRKDSPEEYYLILKELYNWWTTQRPKDWEELEKYADNIPADGARGGISKYIKKDWDQYFKRERELLDLDTTKLHQLIEFREYMWE